MVARLVRLVVRRRRAVLAIAAAAVAASIALAARLRLVTDLAELLPTSDPAVIATHRIEARLGGVATLQIAIEGPDRAANIDLARRLAEALAREPSSLVDRVAYEVRAERAFFERAWWLYLDIAELELVRDKLEREVRWRKNPLLVDLDDDRHALDDLEARIKRRAQKSDRFPDGVFASPDGQLVVVMVSPPGTIFREHAGEELVRRTEALVASLPHTSRVRYAGTVYDSIVERHALESDLAWASALCILLIGAAVALFYGRLAAVPLMAAPALCGVAVALAIASVAFGQLNASTAFLGSIILGNGINAAIIQLARYEEERRAGAELAVALERSVTGTIRATGVAALAAAVAYGSLVATHFRGFSQFGVIGAVGMIAAWIATIVVLPALIATVDQGARPRRRRGIAFGAPFARLAGRAPRAIAAIGGALTVAAVLIIVPYARDPFEYDLRKLRAETPAEHDALTRRIEQIFGTLTPTVLLADRADQTAELADRLRARGAGVLGDVITLDSLLPGSPADQRAKLAVIAEIRRVVTDPKLDDEDRAKLAKWTPPELAPITTADLPAGLVHPFRDLHGELAPLVIAFRAPQISYWNGRDLVKLAAAVRTVELHDGSVIHAGGNAVVFAGMLESISHDGPIATVISFVGVALLVLVLARRARGAAVVLAALVTGVAWMVGGAALAGVRVNFLNFIALPITFGIGVDYAINVYTRHREHGAARIAETLRATGGAVALCSLTTTIGYASLLFADSQALRSFGALAILGEVACLAVALLVLPAWLVLGRR